MSSMSTEKTFVPTNADEFIKWANEFAKDPDSTGEAKKLCVSLKEIFETIIKEAALLQSNVNIPDYTTYLENYERIRKLVDSLTVEAYESLVDPDNDFYGWVTRARSWGQGTRIVNGPNGAIISLDWSEHVVFEEFREHLGIIHLHVLRYDEQLSGPVAGSACNRLVRLSEQRLVFKLINELCVQTCGLHPWGKQRSYEDQDDFIEEFNTVGESLLALYAEDNSGVKDLPFDWQVEMARNNPVSLDPVELPDRDYSFDDSNIGW